MGSAPSVTLLPILFCVLWVVLAFIATHKGASLRQLRIYESNDDLDTLPFLATRFWAQLCMAAKVGPTIRCAKKALEEGKCVVIGLQSTGESVTGSDDITERDEPSSSAEGTIRNLLAGCSIHEDLKEIILEKLADIKLPNNALDEIVRQVSTFFLLFELFYILSSL